MRPSLNKNKQRKYLRKRWGHILDSLDCYSSSEDPEVLHQFRLEIKKAEALLPLYRRCGKKKGLQALFSKLREMFRLAGDIRDTLNALSLVRRYAPARPYARAAGDALQSLQIQQWKKIVRCRHLFLLRAKHYKKQIKRGRQLFAKALLPIPAGCIQPWYETQLQKIQQGLLPSGISRLHDSRKRIKGVLYLSKILPASAVAELHLNVSYLDALQDTIGLWHDAVSAAHLLEEAHLPKKVSKAPIHDLREKAHGHVKTVWTLAIDFYKKATAAPFTSDKDGQG